jgi:hypothetical protein
MAQEFRVLERALGRPIVTSRYQFPLPGPSRLELEVVDALRGADQEKKAARLMAGVIAEQGDVNRALSGCAIK